VKLSVPFAPTAEQQFCLMGEAASPARRRGPPRCSPSQAQRWAVQAEEMMRSGDWSGAEAAHLVALYALVHARVYGAAPAELEGVTYAVARALARRMLEREFEGDVDKMVGYCEWAWRREQARHRQRQALGQEPRRIGWKLFFGGALVTDWRVAGGR